MYSSREIALESLKHCLNQGDPFDQINCGAGCPLWQQCSGESRVILSDLREIILSLDLPAGRTDKILSAIPRCLDQTHELCNQDCPYWSVCGDEDITYLFNDIHALLKEEGVCD